jgi:hypothetical protein
MNNKTKKYLDKVIEFIVEDTIIDNDQDLVLTPFTFHLSFLSIHPPLFHPYPTSFYTYCKEVYGLTNDEIIYVWEKYEDELYEIIEW